MLKRNVEFLGVLMAKIKKTDAFVHASKVARGCAKEKAKVVNDVIVSAIKEDLSSDRFKSTIRVKRDVKKIFDKKNT
jgi:5-carboxymethyl-2-hydroxymuconate isomerase